MRTSAWRSRSRQRRASSRVTLPLRSVRTTPSAMTPTIVASVTASAGGVSTMMYSKRVRMARSQSNMRSEESSSEGFGAIGPDGVIQRFGMVVACTISSDSTAEVRWLTSPVWLEILNTWCSRGLRRSASTISTGRASWASTIARLGGGAASGKPPRSGWAAARAAPARSASAHCRRRASSPPKPWRLPGLRRWPRWDQRLAAFRPGAASIRGWLLAAAAGTPPRHRLRLRAVAVAVALAIAVPAVIAVRLSCIFDVLNKRKRWQADLALDLLRGLDRAVEELDQQRRADAE